MKIKTLNTWEEYKSVIADHSLLDWIFRGQSNADWEIRSSLDRSEIIKNYDDGEERMLFEFQRASKYYLKDNETPNTLIDWLALQQHYGTPTRLIDFTKSPYVAAYFAFEWENKDSDYVAIWIANKIGFYQRSLYYLSAKGFKNFDSKYYAYRDKTFKEIFDLSRTGEYDCIMPLESHFMNERYYLQQSVFLSPSNPYKTFNEQLNFLNESLTNSLIKIEIPKTERKKALRDLEKMNITRASLFPSLDGFAKSLHIHFSTLSNFGDIAENLQILNDNDIIKT